MNITALDALQVNDIDWSGLMQLGTVTKYDATAPELVVERSKDADILIVNKVRLTEAVFEVLPKLKYVGVLATGYDNIDLAAARKHGVAVTNVPGYSTDSVAQLTFALLLELCHHAGAHSDSVISENKWSNQPYYCFWDYPLIELAGKTMGIFGLGRIGTKTAEIARAFGMKVLACSRTEKQIEGIAMVDFDTLLKESDVISLNCPLTDKTRGIMNAAAFAKMKKTAFLINTSRGGVIADDDLRKALDNGVIAGAAVDVMNGEPPKSDNPLLGAKNIIITPHIAWATKEARIRLLDIVTKNIEDWAAGKTTNRVELI